MLLLLLAPALAQADPPHHELQVRLDPNGHSFSVDDTIRLGELQPEEDGAYHFLLHAGLEPELQGRGWRLEPSSMEATAAFVGINDAAEEAQVPLEAWRLLPRRRAGDEVSLRYGGPLHHPLAAQGEEYQRGFSETPGLISEEGVYLAGSSAWLPRFGDQLFTYSVEVRDLDPGWDAVSQGGRSLHSLADGRRQVRWVQDRPTEEAHLVAGPFAETTVELQDGLRFHAFLRQPDPGLAHRYAEATRRALAMYQELVGPYPYPSFALVENFWETGYGMPGFTLLGSQVMRFPWVLATSYPHEILHSWWGNSVYVDYEAGNWCEGLTSYLADHLLAQHKGEDLVYRRSILKKYDDFVAEEDDFPLTEFGARSSAASEAVGYGKSLLLFHMLRQQVGDEAFRQALREFYAQHRHARTTWGDLAAAFEALQPGLGAFVTTWIHRTGAPQLSIAKAEAHVADAHPWIVELELEQRQQAEPYPLLVPVALTLEGQPEPALHAVPCAERSCKALLPCSAKPLRLDVDPLFDLMRDLDPFETPSSLSTVQGDAKALFVLPSAASEEERQAWEALAADWAEPGEATLVLDSELQALPASSAWVLGWQNRFAAELQRALGAQGVLADQERIQLGEERFPRQDHSLVLVARSPQDPEAAWALVAAEPVAAIAGLGRKLPHYSRYSVLAFEGDEPSNVHKATWDAQGSPLSVQLSEGEQVPFSAPERAALAELPARFDSAALGAWVDQLADPALQGRGLGSAGLLEAQALVSAELQRLGLEGAGDQGGFLHSFVLPAPQGTLMGPRLKGSNLLARIPGSDPALADQPVLLMAHLDHLGLGGPLGSADKAGQVHPGADDNASGVAALLGLAGVLAAEPPRPRPVLLAVTSAEEQGAIGSRALMQRLGKSKPFACLNLDTVGRLSSGRLYVLDSASAREWRYILMGVGYTTGLDVAIVPEPLDASDQVACLEAGVPAVQLFTGPHADYHQPGDVAEKVDDTGLAAVAEASYQVVDYLAGRVELLTVTIADAPAGHAATGHPGGGHPGGGHPGGGARKVSLGTMPDFAFPGPGVRVQEVRQGSAAQTAGILAGDVIVALDGQAVQGLRTFSGALKGHQAGDEVLVTVQRAGEELLLSATLEEK